jgi:hypothetical protein
MTQAVAALYVEKGGSYWDLPEVEAWDVTRDARMYPGPLPVVAHPPCQLWVNFAALNYSRWGGEHNRPGNDEGCFAAALAAVRLWGGVLEHPAFTNAWSRFDLPRPCALGWSSSTAGEWVCEVWQSAYGHPARKRTWLFYCGALPPFELNWTRSPGTHQIGRFDVKKPVLAGKAASRTPSAFRDALLTLARHAKG